jgi:hypothetical protein
MVYKFPDTPSTLGIFIFMTNNLELLSDRLNGSQYDPVIWEDIKPLEDKVDFLEALVLDLVDIIMRNVMEDDKEELDELVSTYQKNYK